MSTEIHTNNHAKIMPISRGYVSVSDSMGQTC